MTNSLKFSLDSLNSYMGLHVNRGKSIVFDIGRQDLSKYFQDIINIKEGNYPFKYFGLLLVVGALKEIHFNALFDELTIWLNGWKNKILSLGD